MRYVEIVDLIGEDAAQALCGQYGGCRETIPKIPPDERNKQIRRMFSNGVTRAVLADAFNLSYRQIRRIISE